MAGIVRCAYARSDLYCFAFRRPCLLFVTRYWWSLIESTCHDKAYCFIDLTGHIIRDGQGRGFQQEGCVAKDFTVLALLAIGLGNAETPVCDRIYSMVLQTNFGKEGAMVTLLHVVS